VTEVEFSPRAGQRPSKIALQRLAGYAPNNNLVIEPGTRRESASRKRLTKDFPGQNICMIRKMCLILWQIKLAFRLLRSDSDETYHFLKK
jgi:hypothetical protein